MMKSRKRILALIMAGVMALSLAACGDKDNGTAAESSAEAQETASTEEEEKVDAFAAAQEKMQDVTSMDAKMVMEMEMAMAANGEEQSVKTVTTMNMTCFSDPVRMKIDVMIDMGEAGSGTQVLYVKEEEDGSCNMYMFDGTGWQAQSVSMADLGEYDARSNMLGSMDSSYNFVEDGMEQVDGRNAYKYTGAITGDEMDEAILSSGALDSFSSLGVDEEQLESMMSDLGEIPITLWIDEESLYPVRYEMDMTAPMDKLMTNLLDTMGDQVDGLSMSIPKMSVAMTCSNYNTAAEIEFPTVEE